MGTFMGIDRITIDSQVCFGQPCIRGLRFPVSRLLGLLAAGESHESILRSGIADLNEIGQFVVVTGSRIRRRNLPLA
jgi:hypothetical protein